jgi:hypothetical protein
MFDDEAAYLVGQAMGQLQQPYQPHQRGRRQITPQQAAERAGRSVGRAFQLYLQSGLTKEQAMQKIMSLAQTFGSLE